MPIQAQVDGIGTLEFPDGTDPAVIQRTVKQQIAARPPAQSGLARTEDTSLEGGIRETAANLVSGAVATPIAGLAGLLAAAGKSLGATSADPADVVRGVQSTLTYQPRTTAGKIGQDIVSYPIRKLSQGADYVGGKVLDITGSPAAAAGVNTLIQAAPMALLKGRGKAGEVTADAGPRPPAVDAAPASGEAVQAATDTPQRTAGLASVSQAPTKEALKTASQAAYRASEDAGAVITPESFQRLQSSIKAMTDKEGVDPTLHPDTTAALKRIADTAGPVTLEQLDTLRQIAKDAEGSIKPADRRLAGKTVDAIDDYASGLSQKDLSAGTPDAVGALTDARDLWSRARKADTLDELMNRAELSAPNFSASGLENAVRTEFRALAKNQRRMRVFTPEEQASIRRVATGGPLGNTLRLVGKLAPTGNISAAISAGGGFALGGPVGAVALPTAGLAARYLASRATLRNAARANELVRRGPNRPTQQSVVVPEETTAP